MKRAITAQNVLMGSHRNEQITLTDLLGEGTFGKVYRGGWEGRGGWSTGDLWS